MKTTVTREQALGLLKKYNQEPFHILHGLTVEGTMRWYAKELGYGDEEDFWGLAGLLHDVDFEKYPEEHCKRHRSFWKRSERNRIWSMPSAAMAMDWWLTLSRSMKWKRCCLRQTS